MTKPARSDRLLSGGHDERNLARLSLVLANNRIPKDKASWVKEFPSPDGLGVTIKVVCTAPRYDVVPHGLDNDVLLGLVNAYIAAGMPLDGVVRTTGYSLLQYSSLGDSGLHYTTLAESLRRFQGTVYTITDSWYDNHNFQYRSVNTSLVLRFVMLDKDRQPDAFGDLRADTLLEITLDSDLTASIRGGFIRPLDLQFLRKLTQPLPRLLFRVLSEQRYPVGREQVSHFQVGLRAWAQHLGILDDRPFRIRRALEPAHQQLTDQGFLRSVEYTGRGDTQDVHYTFAEMPVLPADAQAVSLLTRVGVSHAIAVQLAAQQGREGVEAAITQLEGLLESGYQARSRPALLVDLLRHPDKYTNPAALPAPADIPSLSAVTRAAQQASTQAASTQQAKASTPQPELLEAETPRTEQSARFLLRGVALSEEQTNQAAQLFMAGVLSASQLSRLRLSEAPEQELAAWLKTPAPQS